MRTFHNRDLYPMLTLHKFLVVPVLEYCWQLWSPWTPGDIRTLEEVKRSFIHRITSLRDLNYWERLLAFTLSRGVEKDTLLSIYGKLCMG